MPMTFLAIFKRSLVALFSFAVVVVAHAGPNYAPTISGTPAKSVMQGYSYAFTPKAYDANGDTLRFSIANKPSWASFSSSTGRLSGTPTASQVGTYWNIKISVSDGRLSASLPTFAIAVSQASTGSMTVSWAAPTTNTDGSTLTNLAGYRIYYGNSSTSLDKRVSISGTSLTTYVIENLPVGTYYVAMTSVNSSGVESTRSLVVKKIIG